MTPPDQYACLYAEEFPAQALLRLHPELRAKPCVVMEGDPPLELVRSLNTRARQLGLRPGMPRVEVELFPDVTLLTRSQQVEAATRSMLFACAGVFSPRIEDRSAGTALILGIDIAGTEKLFGPPETLARNLLDQVKACGIAASVTLSRNLHAAICLAKGRPRHGSIRIIPPGTEAAALAELPLGVLDLTADQANTFTLWGIHALGMLAALPQNELIARIGQDGKRLRQLARGEHPHLFQPEEPVFTLEERMELDTSVELLDSLIFVLGMMLDPILLRLTLVVFAQHLAESLPPELGMDAKALFSTLWDRLGFPLDQAMPDGAPAAATLHQRMEGLYQEYRTLYKTLARIHRAMAP